MRGRGGGGMLRLSFAGAQREYVEQVTAALKARGVRCFYDADEQVRLWGMHLAEELPRIYARRSAAVVVFISADYAAGAGPGWSAAPRSAGRWPRPGVFVLPARFDDSELPGLISDVVPSTCAGSPRSSSPHDRGQARGPNRQPARPGSRAVRPRGGRWPR